MDGQNDNYSYEEAVDEIARRYGVPRSVYKRMLGQESGDNDSAVSPVGAFTAWQIMPATAKGLGYTPQELKDEPLKAAEGGLRILRDNYKQFRRYAENEKHAWMMSVAGYHTNPKNVLRDLRRGGYGLPDISDGAITTKQHVLKIFDGLEGVTLDRSPLGNIRASNNRQINNSSDRTPFVNPDALLDVVLSELPAQSLQTENESATVSQSFSDKPQPPTMPAPDNPLTSPKPQPPPEASRPKLPAIDDIFIEMRRAMEASKVKQKTSQAVPQPQNDLVEKTSQDQTATDLPDVPEEYESDYAEFLKASEMPDSPDARRQYVQGVLNPLAETEKQQSAQYNRDLADYERQKSSYEAAQTETAQPPQNVPRPADNIRPADYSPNVRYDSATDENLKKGLANNFSFEITSSKNKPVSGRDAVKQAYNSLPENVRAANDAYTQITGHSLWDDENADYLAWADNELKTKGGVIINRNLSYEQKAIVDTFARGGYAGLRNDIKSGSVGDQALDDSKKAQTERDLTLAVSDQTVGKDAFDNPLTPRDYSQSDDRREAEQLRRANDPEYALRRDITEQLRQDRFSNPLVEQREPTEEEINDAVEVYKWAQKDRETSVSVARSIEKLPVVGSFLSGWIGEGGRAAHTVGGILRPFQGLIGDNFYNKLKYSGDNALVVEQETNKDGGIATQGLKLAGALPGALSRLYLFTKLPGKAVSGFALDAGLQSAGRGDDLNHIVKETGKGAVLGYLFKYGGIASNPIESALVKPVAKIGLIGGGTIGIEKAFGADNETAFRAGIINALFELSGSGADIKNKIVKAWKNGESKTVKVDERGQVFEVEPNEQIKPDIETVIDPENNLYKQFDDYFSGKSPKTGTKQVRNPENGTIGETVGKSQPHVEKPKAEFETVTDKPSTENVAPELKTAQTDVNPVKPETVSVPERKLLPPVPEKAAVVETKSEAVAETPEQISRIETLKNRLDKDGGEIVSAKLTNAGNLHVEWKQKNDTSPRQATVFKSGEIQPSFVGRPNYVKELDFVPKGAKNTEGTPGKKVQTPVAESIADIRTEPRRRNETETSRRIVNAYRALYGKPEYTGKLSGLRDALREANEYHADSLYSILKNPKEAAKYVEALEFNERFFGPEKGKANESAKETAPVQKSLFDNQPIETDFAERMREGYIRAQRAEGVTEAANDWEIKKFLDEEFGDFTPDGADSVPYARAKLDDGRDMVLSNTTDVKTLRKGKNELAEKDFPKAEVKKFVEANYSKEKFADLSGRENVFLVMPSTSGRNTIPRELAKRLQTDFGGEIVQSFARPMNLIEAKNKSKIGKINNPAVYELTKDLSKYKGKNVVIVDDVLNTGDTVAGLRRELERQGIPQTQIAALGTASIYTTTPRTVERIAEKLSNLTKTDYNTVYRDIAPALENTFAQYSHYVETAIKGYTAGKVYDALKESSRTLRADGTRTEGIQPAGEGEPGYSRTEIRPTRVSGVSGLAAVENSKRGNLTAPASPNKTTTRTLDANRLSKLDQRRADSINAEYEEVAGLSPKELLPKAEIKYKDGFLYVNAEATELLRHADYVAFKDAESFSYFGRYLNPSNAQRVLNALKMNFSAARFANEQNKYHQRRFIREFENAINQSRNGDIRQIVTSEQAKYGLRAARHEEQSHSADYAAGLKHRVGEQIFKSDPIGRRAMRTVRKNGYSGLSDEAVGREVAAKIWLDTATVDLKMSEAEISHLRDLYVKSIIEKGKTFADFESEFNRVSKSSRNFIKENKQTYEQSGNRAIERTGRSGTRSGAAGNQRIDGKITAGSAENAFGNRPANRGGTESNLGKLSLPERKFIESKTKDNPELAERVADEIAYSKPKKKMTLGDYIIDISSGIPKALKATLDLSAPGRQGLIASIAHPVIAAKSFWKQLRAMKSEKYHKEFVEALDNHPLSRVAKDAGLYISSFGDGSLNAKEEQFMSRILGDERLFENQKAETARRAVTLPVRASERAYATYLDSLRMEVFEALAKQVHSYNRRNGVTDNASITKQLEGVAKFVNYATGRGSLGKFEPAAEFLNVGFFSARNWASRFQVMNPVFYATLPKGARGMVVKDFGLYLSTMATTFLLLKASGADIETNPDDPDMLKLKIGQYRYDLSGSMVQQIRYLAQMVKAGAELDGGKMANRSLIYGRGKLAPLPSAIVSTATGSQISGKPTTAGNEATGLVTPIMLEQLIEGLEKDGSLGAVLVAPDFFGFSTSRYDNSLEAGTVLADYERQLSKAKKGSAEEKELSEKVGAWRKYYYRTKKQEGELPSDMRRTPEEEDAKEKFDKRNEMTEFTGEDEPEKPVKKRDLREKIEFYKANKDTLFSFAKDELESLIIQHAENLRVRGRLTNEDLQKVREIIPDYEPLRPNQPGVNLRPEKLKKPPKLPKLTKPPKF